jgi:hypothetical protein
MRWKRKLLGEEFGKSVSLASDVVLERPEISHASIPLFEA